MADNYVFKLNSGELKIIVKDERVPINTWSSEPATNCLIVSSGIVNLQPLGFICGAGHSGNQTILKLIGASWDSEVGDEEAVADALVSGCSNPTKWELTNKD